MVRFPSFNGHSGNQANRAQDPFRKFAPEILVGFIGRKAAVERTAVIGGGRVEGGEANFLRRSGAQTWNLSPDKNRSAANARKMRNKDETCDVRCSSND